MKVTTHKTHLYYKYRAIKNRWTSFRCCLTAEGKSVDSHLRPLRHHISVSMNPPLCFVNSSLPAGEEEQEVATFFWRVNVATSGFIRIKQIALQPGSCVWRTFFLKRERRKHTVLSVLTAAFLPTHTHTHQYHPPLLHTHTHYLHHIYVHSTCTHFSSCWQQLLCNSPGWTLIYEDLVDVVWGGGGLWKVKK